MRPRVLEAAEAELLSALLYYEDCREGLGHDFYESAASVVPDADQIVHRRCDKLSTLFQKANMTHWAVDEK